MLCKLKGCQLLKHLLSGWVFTVQHTIDSVEMSFWVFGNADVILNLLENPLGLDSFIGIALEAKWKNKNKKCIRQHKFTAFTTKLDLRIEQQLTCTSSPPMIFLVVISDFPLSLRVNVPLSMSSSMTQDPCNQKVKGQTHFELSSNMSSWSDQYTLRKKVQKQSLGQNLLKRHIFVPYLPLKVHINT